MIEFTADFINEIDTIGGVLYYINEVEVTKEQWEQEVNEVVTERDLLLISGWEFSLDELKQTITHIK